MEGRGQQLPFSTSNLFLFLSTSIALQGLAMVPNVHTLRPDGTGIACHYAWTHCSALSSSLGGGPASQTRYISETASLTCPQVQCVGLTCPQVQCVVYCFGYCHLRASLLGPHGYAHCSNISTRPLPRLLLPSHAPFTSAPHAAARSSSVAPGAPPVSASEASSLCLSPLRRSCF